MQKGFEVCPICGDCPRSDNEGKPLCVQLPRPDDCPRDLGTKDALGEIGEDIETVVLKPKPPRTGKAKNTYLEPDAYDV